jgi:hypothetical protein
MSAGATITSLFKSVIHGFDGRLFNSVIHGFDGGPGKGRKR